MHAPASLRHKPKPARLTSWARLLLSCIATLLTCAAHLLTPAQQRRLKLLDAPIKLLARSVARLIFLCALERATPPDNLRKRASGTIRALLRAGAQRHLTNTHGDYDLAAIARTCANPEPAIEDMIAVLETGLTRRMPILPRAACDALRGCAPLTTARALDSS